LNDYDDGFRILDRRQFDVTEKIAYIQRESAILAESNRVGGEQIQFRQVEIANLQKEQAQYGKELEVANNEVTRLTEELQQTRTQLSDLFRTNQALYGQIVTESERLKELAGPGLATVESGNP
jgi:chromosome segregation ATPase